MKIIKIFFPILITLTALLLFEASCNQNRELNEEARAELIDRGNSVSQKLASALMTNLSAQIRQDGIAEAINFCSVAAIPLTDSISDQEGVKVSRVSHLNRNPNNAANEQEMEIIEKYLAHIEAAEPIDPVVIAEEQQYIYYSPILISMPTCLKCHGVQGEDIPAEVSQELQQRYPNDKATGFKMGELRGLFKVAFNENVR